MRIAIAFICFIGSSCAATTVCGAADVVLQLVQTAFECQEKPSDRSQSLASYGGDSKKFIVHFGSIHRRTDNSHVQLENRYSSFISLLSFSRNENAVIATCKKPDCLFRQWIETGCDDSGMCGNVSANSARKEFVNSVDVKLCSSDAAKDAVDGLNELAKRK